MWLTLLDDSWRVLAVGMLLGAGLPILYALAVKSLAWANGDLPGASANPLGRPVAGALFTVIVLAVLVGIGYIVAHGFGYTMTWEGILPSFTKS